MRRRVGSWLRYTTTPAPLRRVVESAFRLRHAGRDRHETWERELRAESGYWRRFLIENPADVAWRSDPASRVPEHSPLFGLLSGLDQERVSILDVGAGPLTCLGFTHPGKTLEITATDPLAEPYDKMLAELGIDPPVRTIRAEGEKLVEQFGRGRFDVAVAFNALDHCHDPVEVVQNMLGTVRVGGHVLLLHTRNEGQHQLYRGLHQWNIDCRDGRFVIWRPDHERDVTDLLADSADVRTTVDGGSVIVDIVKRAEPS